MKFVCKRLRSGRPEIHESRDGNNGGRDQDADRSEVPDRPRSEPDLRWPSVVPVRRHPEFGAIPSGQFPDFAAAAIHAKDEIPDSNEGGEDVRAGPGACGAAAQRNCADRTPEHRPRTSVQKQVWRVGSLLIQRSGLNFSACLTAVPQGALRQARILNRSCTKTRAFFKSPGGRPKNRPRALPMVTCTRAIGAPVATAIYRSNPDATCG